MVCPKCGNKRIDVLDTRPSGMNSIRRRRMCMKCLTRFSTYELTIEQIIDNNNEIRDSIKSNMLKDIDNIFTRPVTEIERYCK